jgi:hypothetical protein
VLLGHKVRAKVRLSGSDVQTLAANNDASTLGRRMLDKLAEKHPLLAEIIQKTN